MVYGDGDRVVGRLAARSEFVGIEGDELYMGEESG
jgi:hypothetical protein